MWLGLATHLFKSLLELSSLVFGTSVQAVFVRAIFFLLYSR
jgi:hypothetical protein